MYRYVSVWNSDDLARDSNSSSEERKEDQEENESLRDSESIRESCPRKFKFKKVYF